MYNLRNLIFVLTTKKYFLVLFNKYLVKLTVYMLLTQNNSNIALLTELDNYFKTWGLLYKAIFES